MNQIGKYKVLHELGRGGFGAVYLCEDNLRQKVAVKVFDPKDDVVAGMATSATSDAGEVLKQRFQDEAVTLRKLSSNPYIVDLYDFDETEDGIAFYVMPYLEQSLVNEIGRDVFSVGGQEELPPEDLPRRIPPQRAIYVLTQILEAMKTVHQEGLVHRDLKPANILFDKAGPSGKVQVCDFGIAKLPDTEHSQSGVGMGSRNYMSKEQRESAKHVDASSDVFAIGIMAYRMLTGTLPDGRFQDPIVYAPSIGQPLNDLILRAISVEPTERPKDGGAFLKELKLTLKAMDESTPVDEETGTWVESGASSIRDELKPLRDQIEKLLLEHGELPDADRDTLQAVAMVADLDSAGFDTLVTQIEDALSPQIKPIKNYLVLIDTRLAKPDFGDQDKTTLYAAGEAVGWDRGKVDELIRARLPDPSPVPKVQPAEPPTSPNVTKITTPLAADSTGSKASLSRSNQMIGIVMLVTLVIGGGWWLYDHEQPQDDTRIAVERPAESAGKEQAAWARAQSLNTIDSYESYSRESFATLSHKKDASRLIDSLKSKTRKAEQTLLDNAAAAKKASTEKAAAAKKEQERIARQALSRKAEADLLARQKAAEAEAAKQKDSNSSVAKNAPSEADGLANVDRTGVDLNRSYERFRKSDLNLSAIIEFNKAFTKANRNERLASTYTIPDDEIQVTYELVMNEESRYSYDGLELDERYRELQQLSKTLRQLARRTQRNDEHLSSLKGALSHEALMSMAPDSYALQMLGSASKQGTQKFMENYSSVLPALYYVTMQRDGKPWFVVMQGDYPSKEVALIVYESFPDSVKNQRDHPWARSFGGLQEVSE